MVNLKHILRNRTCPTLDSSLYDDIEMIMEDKQQKYGEFPPRDHLFKREDLVFYEKNPILKKLIEHYQSFFVKGINYESDGRTWNVYPRGRMLWYCNEAFSLCTKLSIDPSPEHYFIDEYYDDIGGGCTEIERYFILSIVYALLAVNRKVRRQHLKMIDVLYNFMSNRCPFSVMFKCMDFITKTYVDNNAICYEFRPAIDRWGYTLLNVNEGLIEDDEEQMELYTQMRKKVCENWIEWKKFAKQLLSTINDQGGVSDEKKRQQLETTNTVIKTTNKLGKTVVNLLELYRFLQLHFAGNVQYKYEWYALRRFLQKYDMLKEGVDNVEFETQMNHSEWFGYLEDKKQCSQDSMNDYNFLNNLKPEEWRTKWNKRASTKARKEGVDNIYTRFIHLENHLPLFKDKITNI